jgi:hypothetical protein
MVGDAVLPGGDVLGTAVVVGGLVTGAFVRFKSGVALAVGLEVGANVSFTTGCSVVTLIVGLVVAGGIELINVGARVWFVLVLVGAGESGLAIGLGAVVWFNTGAIVGETVDEPSLVGACVAFDMSLDPDGTCDGNSEGWMLLLISDGAADEEGFGALDGSSILPLPSDLELDWLRDIFICFFSDATFLDFFFFVIINGCFDFFI